MAIPRNWQVPHFMAIDGNDCAGQIMLGAFFNRGYLDISVQSNGA